MLGRPTLKYFRGSFNIQIVQRQDKETGANRDWGGARQTLISPDVHRRTLQEIDRREIIENT